MIYKESVYIPPRMAWQGVFGGNSVVQLKQSGQIEYVDIEHYNTRGVVGWTLHRANEERILVVSKRTLADPYGVVLHIPGIDSLPTSKEDAGDNWRWLKPRTRKLDDTDVAATISAEARASWIDNFNFIEEIYGEEAVIRHGLRTPQLGALYASLAHWKVTQDVGTVVMPTGTGKTETMLALLVQERPACLLVVVPTATLRDQIAEKFMSFGVLQQFGVIGKAAILPVVGKVEHLFASADDATGFLKSCNVAVATMAVIGGCSDEVQGAVAKQCSHLFIDEAHHSPATTWNAFRERVCKENKPVLQFTATPFRRDGKHVGGKSIFTYPLKKAQEERYFTPITFISIWEYNRDHGDTVIAQRAIRVLQNDLDNGFDHLVMARTDNIQRARQVYEIYFRLAPEFSPIVLHSKQKDQERASAIEALRGRRSRIVVCVDMLGEGFDLPQLKVAALHDIHKSLAVTIQFTGRFTRTATGLGEATIIANAADADVEEALEDLYSKDSDWNLLLRRLSEGETSKQRRRSDFIDGFQNVPSEIALHNIYPKMSTVVYKTTCENWKPDAVWELIKNIDLLVEPTINPVERVLLFITHEQIPVAWGETKSVQNVIHDLYLVHWDENQSLLFINSTNNKSTHFVLAEALGGEDAELIRGEHIYRSLDGINRLILANLGMIHLLSRAVQFTMHVGSDIKEGLSRASVSNRRKSNLFGRGYEDGESVTIGASHKGRVWSHRIAEGISEWVMWCQHVGRKLLDESISTEKILDHVIIPEKVEQRPNLVPLTIDWPLYFLQRNDEAVFVEIDDRLRPFFQADLEIVTFADTGPLCFRVAIDDVQAEYELVFGRQQVEYVPTTTTIVYLSASGRRSTLTEWFQEESPIITFEDMSQLEYNEIFRPKSEWEPYDASRIQGWTWAGVALNKESQYKAHRNPARLELRRDSIQRHVIEHLLAVEDDIDYDIIFDDDGAGEIADIVALKVAGDNLIVHLFHCKYSKSDTAGVRVGDLYEVCGQAQKSVYWRRVVKDLFERLRLREIERQKTYGISRFEKGDLQQLDALRRRSRFLAPRFQISIIQPGLDTHRVDASILNLLGATELYLRETFDVPLTIIGSGNDIRQV
ncbi:MAG: DEAD/DEAH box helicase family protein [bacterium]|nr:DEAD/DEAH box helicase family protein [bacterium]